MRSRIMVICRDAALRARVAKLVARAGCRVEVAETFKHARRAGLEGIALAIVAPGGLDHGEAAAIEELGASVGRVLVVASPDGRRSASPDIVDASDEAGLIARIAEARTPDGEREAAGPTLEFAGHRLDIAGQNLVGSSGKDIPLTHGEFVLLRTFAERPGRVLSRDQLLQLIAGRDAESYDRSVDMQILRLRRKIEPDPKRPRLIVTVPGSGYKFAAAVREAKPYEQAPKDADQTIANQAEAAAPAVAAKKSAGSRLSVVVLPFDNIGRDPEQEYFVDGVTESLTTDLSRINDSFVIARNTAFAYKGKQMDVRAIARELNVRYIIEGSVQRSGARMRVNVQLVDAENAVHLWSERFDKRLADFFDMQDEIVARVANQLEVELVAAQARRTEKAPNPDSMDVYFQARAILSRGATPDILARAHVLCERALQMDSRNVHALVEGALVDIAAGANFMSEDRKSWIVAETKLSKALAAAPELARAHYAMGWVLCMTKRAERGVEELERALAIDPNLARAHAAKGWAKIMTGRAEETEAHVLEALRLSPRDPTSYMWFHFVGQAKTYLGEFVQALPWLRKSIDANRNWPWGFLVLAACLAHLGRFDEARREAKAGLAVLPDLTLCRFRQAAQSDNPVHLAQRERLIAGMRLAGVPEE